VVISGKGVKKFKKKYSVLNGWKEKRDVDGNKFYALQKDGVNMFFSDHHEQFSHPVAAGPAIRSFLQAIAAALGKPSCPK
jgi:hypothetical protein